MASHHWDSTPGFVSIGVLGSAAAEGATLVKGLFDLFEMWRVTAEMVITADENISIQALVPKASIIRLPTAEV